MVGLVGIVDPVVGDVAVVLLVLVLVLVCVLVRVRAGDFAPGPVTTPR